MHLRIYLWLSCVVVAGYVRATEEVASTAAAAADVQNDQPLPADRDLYLDDEEGSGLDRESSGSGGGPGDSDDEDWQRSRVDGSGDGRYGDDEDFLRPIITSSTPSTSTTTTTTTTTPEPIITDIVPFDDEISTRVLEPKTPDEGPDSEEPRVPDQRPEIDISEEDTSPTDQNPEGSNLGTETRPSIVIMNTKPEDRATSFFAQPGILAAVIGGAVVGLLCAILVVMFIVYRMRKKDEGSYALDEPKRSPAAASYGKGHNNREFYA